MRFSRSSLAPALALASALAHGLACDVVPATNRFDPATPADAQAPATLRGKIVLDDSTASAATLADELASVVVRVVDRNGAVIDGADGNPLPVPVTVADGVGSFGLELAPQTVRLDITVPERFVDGPTLSLVTLVAGDSVDLGTLTYRFTPPNPGQGPGSISGSVVLSSGAGGERLVQVFDKSDSAQRLVATTTTDASGAFSVTGLGIGTYAIAATLDDYTPDYRLDITLEDNDAGRARVFSGGDALTLHPVTAVLLPQLDRVEGNFYTASDDLDLAVLAFGGVTGMRLAAVDCAEGCDVAPFTDADAYVGYDAGTTVALPDVDGAVKIFAQFEVRGSFVFTSPTFATTVIRDTTAPEVRSVVRFGGAAGDIIATDDTVNVDVNAFDVGGIAAVATTVVAPDAVVDASVLAFDLVVTPPGPAALTRTVALPADDGLYDLVAVVRDRAGNLSEGARVRVRKDTAPADALPLVIDAISAGEGRAVVAHVHFDATGATALPTAVQLGATLPADTLTGRVAFDVASEYDVIATAVDGQTLTIQARLFDEVDNSREVHASAPVVLQATISGTIDAEQLGAGRLVAGTAVRAVDSRGVTVASGTTDASGAYVLAGVPEGRVTVVATRDGYRSFSQEFAFVEADSDVAVDTVLPLRRGALVGKFRKQDKDGTDGVHGNIAVTVRLVSQTRLALPRPALTGADGDWSLDLVPATLLGETYEVVANTEGYGQGVVENVVVDDNLVTVVNPDANDAQAAVAVLLPPLSGDFDVCSAAVAAGSCAPLAFTNQNQVRVHLRNAAGVTRLRAAAVAMPSEGTLPLAAFDAAADPVVTLPNTQGNIAVFVDVERDGGRQVLGPVQVFRDTVAPSAPSVSISRGSKARRDGFTNEAFVSATVSLVAADADDSTVESPLARAPTFFDATTPTTPRSSGVALCNDGLSCTVLLPSLAGVVTEQTHNLFAFACDAAGNCSSAAGTASIVFDRTPPSALNGVNFVPFGARVVASNGDFLTGSGAYAVAINVGTALTEAGIPVVDTDGVAVRDVDAVALSFVAAIDDDDAVDLVGGDAPGSVAEVAGLPLLGGEGDYDVFARFVDAAGNATIVEPNPFTFTLTLDETAPTARLVLANDAALTNTQNVATRIDNLSESGGSAKYGVDAADCQASAGYVATAALPTTVSLSNTDGAQVVVLCLKDKVGNVGFASDSITLDRVAPVGEVVLDGGAAFSGDRSLVATFQNTSADTARVKTLLRKTTDAALSCTGGTYNAFTATQAANISAGDGAGTFVFDACFEDTAGNRSAAPVSDSILFDATAPVVTLSLNAGATFTTSGTVTATVGFSDPDIAVTASAMRFASSLSFAGQTEAFAATRAGLSVDTPTVEGSKQLCVEVTDSLGRTSTACDSITLDLLPPAGTLTVAAFATASPVSATLRSADLNIASAAAGEGLDCSTATFTALSTNTDSVRSVTLADTTTESSRTIVACFKDSAGNVGRVEKTLAFDPNDPALAQAVSPTSGSVVGTKRPVFTWAAVAGAVRFQLLVRRVDTQASVINQSNITTLSFTPTADLPETALEWIVVATKASGRSSTVNFTSAPRVTVDATAPTAATAISITAEAGKNRITTPAPCTATNPCLNDSTPTVAFTAGTDAIDTALTHVVEITRGGDVAFNAPVFSTTRASGSAFDVGANLEDGNYLLRVRTLDDAGNTGTSASSTFVIDRTGPDAPTILPLVDPVSSTVASSVIVKWTAEGPSGAVGYKFQITNESSAFSQNDTALNGVTNTSVDVRALLSTGGHVRHILRVASVDALGNQSPYTLGGFANDTTAPCSQNKQLNIKGTDAADSFTNSAAVVVEIVCGSDPSDPFDAPARVQVGCDGDVTNKPSTAFTGVSTCVLPNPDGSKSVAAKVFDAAGNSTTVFTDAITLDRRAPTTPVLSIDEAITNNPLFSFSILEASSDTNFLRHEFIDGVDVVSFDDARAVIPGSTVNLTLLEERTYNVRVRGIDSAGNASAEALAKVTFDITPPTRPDIANNDAPVVVNADSFSFFLTAPASDAHFDHYQLSTNGGAFVEVAGDGVFTVPLAQNSTSTFALRGVDLAGNIGASDAVTVIEDSRNPRPLALNTLPPFTAGGAPSAISTSTFTTRGAYVDVHFDRTETSVAASVVDANFDHYEVRATARDFINFVPLCATATALCPTTVTTDVGTTIVGADHLITQGGNIVGFRIPLVRGALNTVTVRAVDKAGNTSVETSTSTTDVSVIRATDDDAVEVDSNLFGDRLVTVNGSTKMVTVHEPGADALLGTADDVLTDLRTTLAASSVFEHTSQPIAQGPDMVALTFQNGGNTIIIVTTAGLDHEFSAQADNFIFNANDNPLVAGDELLNADQPTIWQKRVAFRRQVSGTDTDIIVREAGNNGFLGDSDDRFATVADDAVFQSFPQLSGENLAFFKCNNSSCTGVGDPTLVVVNSGADKLFGNGDDVVRTLTQAVGVDSSIPPRLYTPGTQGRAACKNVVAWAGDSAHKGVFVVSTGPDLLFDTDDTAVQVMNTEAQGSGNIGGFALSDDVVVASDFFAPPTLEVVTGGRDGCLTRTADNLAFDSGLSAAGTMHAVHDGRVVTHTVTPTNDVLILDLGANRRLWSRNDGASQGNFDADVDGVALGGSGVFDLATHSVQTAFNNSGEDVDANRSSLLHGQSSTFISSAPVFSTLTAQERGIDDIWGTADDRNTVISSTHPLSLDNNLFTTFAVTYALDGDVAVWAGKKSASTVVPVLHFAGADGQFGVGGDDCEVELSSVQEANYMFVRSSQRRQAFQHCTTASCASVGNISVREVTGDICTGTSTTSLVVAAGGAPDIDGGRLVYLLNGVHVMEGGADGKLTTIADNVDKQISNTTTSISQAPRISGDRVVYVDSRTETSRVVVADLADGSERVLSRSTTNNQGVTIEGDLVVFGSAIEGSFFSHDVDVAWLAMEPDLPQDARNPAPTRQRCPDDDVFEENDSSLTATPMNSGASVNGIVCKADDDRFQVNVPAVGCVVRAKTKFTHANGDLDLQLLDPTGAVVASSTSTSDAETIVFTATRTGAHVARVFGFNNAENTYDVGLTVTCP